MVGYYHDESKAKSADLNDLHVCGHITSVEIRDEKNFVMVFREGDSVPVRADTAQEAQRWISTLKAKTEAVDQAMPSLEVINEVRF